MALLPEHMQVLQANCSVLSTVRQEDDEQAWLAARTHGIGGSDVGAICGVNNWSSAKQIYFRKVGMYQDETKPDNASSERMHFGHMLEPVVANEFVNRNPEFYCLEADCTFKNNQYPFLLANVDRFVINKETNELVGILECKTASENMKTEWENGDVPISYYYQVQHYLYVTGLNRAWISCLVGGNKFYTYDIFFDKDLYASMIFPALKTFWFDNVLKLQEPQVQSADDDFFGKIFPADVVNNDAIDLVDKDIDDIGNKLMDAKARKKAAEKEISEYQAAIKDRLKEHTIGRSPSYEFKWAPRTRTDIDRLKLQMEYPEIYAECLTTTSYRQMTVKKVSIDE